MNSLVLLFYKYVPIDFPVTIAEWQKSLGAQLGLTGRIIIAHEGINGTLAGTITALNQYKYSMEQHPLFSAIDYKESPGNTNAFPRFKVMIKPEIVKLGITSLELSSNQAAPHLTPAEFHQKLQDKQRYKDSTIVVFDARNNYESRIGAFESAVTPNTATFRELPDYIDNNLELFNDKEVLMYCTGGVRCERASAYLQSKNITRAIYQLKGGIHRYLEQFPDGFFKGKNFVFDERGALNSNFTNSNAPDAPSDLIKDTSIISQCDNCSAPWDQYSHCINSFCNKLLILCPSCNQQEYTSCSTQCHELLHKKQVPLRFSRKERNKTA